MRVCVHACVCVRVCVCVCVVLVKERADDKQVASNYNGFTMGCRLEHKEDCEKAIRTLNGKMLPGWAQNTIEM